MQVKPEPNLTRYEAAFPRTRVTIYIARTEPNPSISRSGLDFNVTDLTPIS